MRPAPLSLGLYSLALAGFSTAWAGPYAPAAGKTGSTAIPADSSLFVGWATGVAELNRGLYDVSQPTSPTVSFGFPSAALGAPNPFNEFGEVSQSPNSVVSLGDGGSITLNFAQPITNGAGPDFAVFENAFDDTFLELAFVEVSSDGLNFVRFPTDSLTQTNTQITMESAVLVDASNIDGFAGKYRAGWGTPFDLALLGGWPGVNIDRIVAIRLFDVVGSINPAFGRRDTSGDLINDPWITPYSTGGFDLDAIGVIHQIPEPAGAALLATGLLVLSRRKRSI